MRSSALILAVVVAISAIYGCVFHPEGLSATTGTTTSASGGGTASSASTGGAPCTTKDQCPPDNPCTTYECTMGQCVASKQSEGMKVLDEGSNCKTTVCTDGVPTTATDLDDFEDDGDPCTSDACDDNGPIHTPANDGTDCGPPGQHCFHGQCLDCATRDQCPQGSNPCKPATCFGGVCGFADEPDGVSCANSTECKNQGVCSGGTCVQKDKSNGVTCGVNTGTCVGGVCCFGTTCESGAQCCLTFQHCDAQDKCTF